MNAKNKISVVLFGFNQSFSHDDIDHRMQKHQMKLFFCHKTKGNETEKLS